MELKKKTPTMEYTLFHIIKSNPGLRKCQYTTLSNFSSNQISAIMDRLVEKQYVYKTNNTYYPCLGVIDIPKYKKGKFSYAFTKFIDFITNKESFTKKEIKQVLNMPEGTFNYCLKTARETLYIYLENKVYSVMDEEKVKHKKVEHKKVEHKKVEHKFEYKRFEHKKFEHMKFSDGTNTYPSVESLLERC